MSADCPPRIEKLVAGARSRQYRLNYTWWRHRRRADAGDVQRVVGHIAHYPRGDVFDRVAARCRWRRARITRRRAVPDTFRMQSPRRSVSRLIQVAALSEPLAAVTSSHDSSDPGPLQSMHQSTCRESPAFAQRAERASEKASMSIPARRVSGPMTWPLPADSTIPAPGERR